MQIKASCVAYAVVAPCISILISIFEKDSVCTSKAGSGKIELHKLSGAVVYEIIVP